MGAEITELIKSKKDLWRYKVAVMHRTNVKEIFARQIHFLTIVKTTLQRLPETKLQAAIKVKCEDESENAFAKSRLTLRNYFRELSKNSKALFGVEI